MAVPNIYDEVVSHTLGKIKVEYEWKPPHCLECHVFGHAADQCPKHIHENPKPVVVTSDDGFTTVVNKRSRGKGVANPQRTNKGSFSGVRVNNPNKNFVHQPVKKVSDQKPSKKEGNNVENNNGIKLKNLFEKLNEITGIVDPSGDDGEAVTLEILTKKIILIRMILTARQLWSNLDMHKYVVRGFPWVLMGDFNVALNLEVSFSSSLTLNSAMYDFKACVIKIEVMDFNVTGLHFTWNQKPKGGGGVLKKLNRIMEVMKRHQNTQIDGHNMFKVVSKTKLLKKPLRKLLHDQGNLYERVNKLRLELDEVQKALDTNLAIPILHEEECVYVQAFNEAKLDEERFLKQKAKVVWLEAGDTNSTYFHKTIKCRNQRSRIDSILNTNNVEVSGSLVPDVFVSHYQQFLGSSTNCNILNEEGLFSNKVPTGIASNMVCDVTNNETKAAMFDVSDDRAPGLNGYTSVFFKKNGLLLVMIFAMRVNDYRPTSCCNVIYKCISKIITNRFMEGIKEVVSDNQSAFIPGRRISDNILIMQELMHNYHRNRGSPRCAFKIDIQKAYDTVDWKFLENILIKFGFHNTMVKKIMACVSSTSFSLSINGKIHGFFKGKRGVMEILTLILKRWVRLSESFRYHRLLNKDCKILVEKAKNRIGDWKNKSLSFAERLRLYLVSNGTWSWPQSWLLKAPNLGLITCPALVSSVADLWQWRDRNGNISSFSVAKAWEAIRPHDNLVAWSRIIWFSHNIPHHAFHLCKSLELRSRPCSKLILVASAYFIWMERNNKTFKNTKRSSEEIRDLIMVTVRLKLISFRFKNTTVEAISLERVSPVRVAHRYSGLEEVYCLSRPFSTNEFYLADDKYRKFSKVVTPVVVTNVELNLSKDVADDGFEVAKKKQNKKKKHQKQVDRVVLNKPSLNLHYRRVDKDDSSKNVAPKSTGNVTSTSSMPTTTSTIGSVVSATKSKVLGVLNESDTDVDEVITFDDRGGSLKIT
uniref:Reverse transcriptase domain-containing protein n=1 Tax=Tanacetum cinerariifolium TaxID=118510 RepID=A0A6L2JWK1_TANCI|nr:hypothetical protein [Tanacetum cinerariifolium]